MALPVMTVEQRAKALAKAAEAVTPPEPGAGALT
jgi:hypothetical protein